MGQGLFVFTRSELKVPAIGQSSCVFLEVSVASRMAFVQGLETVSGLGSTGGKERAGFLILDEC